VTFKLPVTAAAISKRRREPPASCSPRSGKLLPFARPSSFQFAEWGRTGSRGGLTTEQTRTELTRLATKTPRHSAWVMAVAVGLACAAFGRLLGVDWPGTGPVFLASCIGQFVRRELLTRHVNVFICASLVSFLSSLLGGLWARWAGSETIATAMVASILLLVPGIPSVNAQNDILEGHPTLGSARAVTVAVILIFAVAGLWFGQVLLACWH